MSKEQLATMATTFMRYALAAGIGIILTSGTGVLDMGAGDWRVVGNAAIGAGLVVLYKFLSPDNTEFGIGAKTPDA